MSKIDAPNVSKKGWKYLAKMNLIGHLTSEGDSVVIRIPIVFPNYLIKDLKEEK